MFLVALLVFVMFGLLNNSAAAQFDNGEQAQIYPVVRTPYPELIYTPEACQEGSDKICFGDYYKVLPKTSYVNKVIVPDTIVIHTDDQSGKTPEKWFSTTTWNGLAGRDSGGRSVHFGVGLDGIGQFLTMYEGGVIQCRGAGRNLDSHSVQIEMGGRSYNTMLNGKASPAMVRSIEIITAQTVDLVLVLMETYDIPIENVIGHYEVEGSGKTDPGDIYLEQYFLPLLKKKLGN